MEDISSCRTVTMLEFERKQK